MSSRDLTAILRSHSGLSHKWKMGGESEEKVYDLGSDSLWVVTVSDTGEGLFTDKFIYVFRRTNGFQPVLITTFDGCRYAGDTVLDADFDGHLDYLLKDYSCVGCCPRDYSYIYLFRNGTLDTLHVADVINAYFDHDHQTIQQMDYGHPPTLTLTKSRWRADTLQLLESISRNISLDTSARGYSQHQPPYWRQNHLTGIEDYLNDVPAEYKGVYDFEWFTY